LPRGKGRASESRKVLKKDQKRLNLKEPGESLGRGPREGRKQEECFCLEKGPSPEIKKKRVSKSETLFSGKKRADEKKADCPFRKELCYPPPERRSVLGQGE